MFRWWFKNHHCNSHHASIGSLISLISVANFVRKVNPSSLPLINHSMSGEMELCCFPKWITESLEAKCSTVCFFQRYDGPQSDTILLKISTLNSLSLEAYKSHQSAQFQTRASSKGFPATSAEWQMKFWEMKHSAAASPAQHSSARESFRASTARRINRFQSSDEEETRRFLQ